jgi:hypothetical protein
MRARSVALWVVGSFLSACGGGSKNDSGVVYDQPQIYPDKNPLCLADTPIAAGEVLMQNVLLENAGRQQLQIMSATIAMDARRVFKLMGPTPNAIDSLDFAVAGLRYAPRAPGWDAVALQVRSNAANYPRLDIYVLALAVPPGLDGGPWDAGPPPASAMGSCAAKPDGGM